MRRQRLKPTAIGNGSLFRPARGPCGGKTGPGAFGAYWRLTGFPAQGRREASVDQPRPARYAMRGGRGSETFRAPRGANRAAAHADKMCRILINQSARKGCIGDDLTLENGDKPRSAGRKPAERETPKKPSRGGKRPGAGRPSLGLAPTSAAVAEPVADQSVINQKIVVDAAELLMRYGRGPGRGKKAAAEEPPGSRREAGLRHRRRRRWWSITTIDEVGYELP